MAKVSWKSPASTKCDLAPRRYDLFSVLMLLSLGCPPPTICPEPPAVHSFADQVILVAAKTMSGGSLDCSGDPCVIKSMHYHLMMKSSVDMVVMAFRLPMKEPDICVLAKDRIEYLGKSVLIAGQESQLLARDGVPASPMAASVFGREEIYLIGLAPNYYKYWNSRQDEQKIVGGLTYLLCSRLPDCNQAKDDSVDDPPPVKDPNAKSKSEVILLQRVALWRKG